ncbi:abhydrolase domain containing Hydr1 isoform X1 [Cotesia typhae]|uniref:abhydrolase domain containing Hydr1 isoform X1 n=1 Tax=Cotesia typhae TaxID=2053667 RepID=UPI003D685AFF
MIELKALLDLPLIYSFIILISGYYIYYLIRIAKTPILFCGDDKFRKLIVNNMEIVKEKFLPTPWCLESRAQTIAASIIRGRMIPEINYRREILKLQDGGEVALDWVEDSCNKLAPIVIILPGLTGTSQAEYIRCLVIGGRKIGIKCVIFNNRGLSGVSLKTPRAYCAANCEDFTEVLTHVRKLNPNVQIGACGISMGGLILGNYLAKEREKAIDKLQATFVLSVPWNIIEGTKSIESGFNRFLNRLLTKALTQTFRSMHDKVHEFFKEDLEKVFKSKTVREFDSAFTAKHFGYENVDEYYKCATLHDKLQFIRVPLFCLNAADDPFQPFEVIPLKEVEKCKNIAFLITSHGGHIGFLQGMWPTKEEQYITKLFSQYFCMMFFKKEL